VFVYPAVEIAAGVLGSNRLRRAPNVQCESCLSDKDRVSFNASSC